MTGRDAEREQLAAALRERRDNPAGTGNPMLDFRPGAPCMDCGDYPGPRHEDSDCPRAVARALLPVVDRIANERAAAALETAAGAIEALRPHIPPSTDPDRRTSVIVRSTLNRAARTVRAALRASNGEAS